MPREPSLTKPQQMFLQRFMSQGLLSSKKVKDAFQKACRAHSVESDNEQMMVQYVLTINQALGPYHLEIKKAVSEEDGKQFYGLVSTAETNISKLSTNYSENEYEFFKKIVELVVESDSGHVSSLQCLLIVDQLEKKMAKKDAEDLMKRLESDGWLKSTKEGQIQLSTRCILELDQYIKEQFPDNAVNCNACNRLCVQGQKCDQCDTRLHLACASKLFKQIALECPNEACKAAWPHARPNLGGNSGGSPNKSQQSQSQPQTQTSTRKRRHQPE